MMTKYHSKIQEVKERADIISVCNSFGIKLNRADKALCPFHNDSHPSFSISRKKQIFKCFSCGAAGDSVYLVSRLLNVNNYEAAKQINSVLKLGVEFEGKVSRWDIAKYQNKNRTVEEFKKWEEKTFILLCDYLHRLQSIEDYYKIPEIEYYIDEVFINGTIEDKLDFWKNNRGMVKRIERFRLDYK